MTAPACPPIGAGASLPGLRSGASAAAAPRIVRDLTRDLSRAAGAVRALPVTSCGSGDVTVAAHSVVVCTADSAARALEEAAAWCRQAPEAEVHCTAWARVPGHREDVCEYRISLTVSFPDDDTGEYPGDTHHAPCR
ncbi:hypothetical protein ACIGXM_11140 [Kitasatospora sp. NPDC052896]|uniref:hypothetical protein n=1 Tax=Kitasatospora sp. NPDC052896 TaxID=3364061 RepID=UPI0037C9E14C